MYGIIYNDMTKEELSRAYTHKKVAEKIVSDISEFMPSDIIQAYEDGFNKAVELARKCLVEWSSGYIAKTTGGGVNARKRLANDVLNYFKKYMEE